MKKTIILLNAKEAEKRVSDLREYIRQTDSEIAKYNTVTIPFDSMQTIHCNKDGNMVIDCDVKKVQAAIDAVKAKQADLRKKRNSAYDEILMLKRNNEELMRRGWQVITLDRSKLFN